MGPPFAKPLAESGCQAPLHTDAEPVAAPPAPAGLDFIANEDAAMGADDPLDDLEIFLGRRDETAHALEGFGDESATLPQVELPTGSAGILRAYHFARGIGEAERATIAIRIMRVHDAGLRQAEPSRALAGTRHRRGGRP